MKRIKLVSVILMSALLMAGCGKKEADPSTEQEEKKPAVTQETEVTEEEQDEQKTEDSADKETSDTEDTDTDAEPQEEKREVRIYYIDDATGEPASENMMISDENDIWAALQEKGILEDNCKLLSFKVDEANGQIDLDFNAALGDRIRSFGTTGETEIIGCLINTYLDAYGCDGIRLTEEGSPLETSSGANFDGYSGKIEF